MNGLRVEHWQYKHDVKEQEQKGKAGKAKKVKRWALPKLKAIPTEMLHCIAIRFVPGEVPVLLDPNLASPLELSPCTLDMSLHIISFVYQIDIHQHK